MIYNAIPLCDEQWISAMFFAGETDFRDRAIAELRRLERAERRFMRTASTAQEARRYRERADALKGAASFLAKLEPKGSDSPILRIANPAAND